MSNQPLDAPPAQSSARIRIQAINVDLTTPAEHPISLKLLLNSQVNQLLEPIAVGKPLQWTNVAPIDVKPGDFIELRVYENYWLFRKMRIGVVRLQGDKLNRSPPEIEVNDTSGLVPCFIKFSFLFPDVASNLVQATQQAAVAAINCNRSILERMGKARDWVDAIIKFGGLISEDLGPMAEVVFSACKVAWEVLEKQYKYDKLVEELVISMGDVLPFIDIVHSQVKVANLKATVVSILRLIEDASRFVIEYKSDGVAVSIFQFVSSTARGQVDEFVRRFKNLKEDFDRGMKTQIVLRLETLLNHTDREMIKALITPDSNYDPDTGCLEGTRTAIRSDIQQWVDSSEASESLFWLCGVAGCGKSTIVRSVCEELRSGGCLGGTFFCKRDNEHLNKPENMVSTLAARLAFSSPDYGANLAAALHEEPDLITSALALRFQGMILGPLQIMGKQYLGRKLVIIIDALDECGTVDTRPRLASHLLKLSNLAPWLKVVVTSRPNNELASEFGKQADKVLRRDLFQEDLASVTRDITLFIRDCLMQLPNDDEALHGRSWLHDETAKHLATRANGLFIWARTACSMIRNSLNPDKKIQELISSNPSSGAGKQLELLYETVLNEALGETQNDARTIKSCISAVITTRIPLTDVTLAKLLESHVDLTELRIVIRRLAAVLYRDLNGTVRVIHQSFSDYMVDKQCPSDYRINKAEENLEIATSCLRTMHKELRFNICELEDSRLFNDEISDLSTRTREKIHSHLEYSCIYWASHLAASHTFNEDFKEHQIVIRLLEVILLSHSVLYWIEVLSLLKQLYTSEASLLEVIDWVKDPTHNVSIHADEMRRFVAAFYLPISLSAPHLYLSALAFGSYQFEAIGMLKTDFPNTLELVRGKYLAKLSNSWLRVIPHPSPVISITYSPDGKLFATISESNNTIQLWEARSGTPFLNPLEGHSNTVTCITFSPDGQYIISGSSDNTVRVWNLQTGTAAFESLGGHSSAVTRVAVSPDGQRIVSASQGNSVRVWDLHTGAVAFSSHDHSNSEVPTCIAVSPNGRHIIFGFLQGATQMKVWDLRTGAVVFDLPQCGRQPDDLNYYFNGRQLNGVTCIAVSPNSQYIMTDSRDNTVRVWNVHTWAAAFNPLQGHSKTITCIAVSRDGKYIISGSRDKTLRIWDLHTRAAAFDPLQGHSDTVRCIAVSPNGHHIISSSDDKTVRVWNLQTGTAAFDPLQGHSGIVTCIAVSPDGQHIISGSRDNTVRVWDLRISAGAVAFDPLQGHSDAVTCVAISPNGEHIISGSQDKTLQVWGLQNGTAASNSLQGHLDGAVACIAISPDSQRIISGSLNNTVQAWDLRTGAAAFNPIRGCSGIATSIAASPNCKYVISGSWDNTVRVWDMRVGIVAFDPLCGHSGTVTCIAVCPYSRYIISGSQDKTLRVWKLPTGAAAFNPLRGHSNTVTCIAVSPDGRYIVSGSRDNTVRVWELHTGAAAFNPLHGHSGTITCVVVSRSPIRRYIATGSQDNTVRVWDLRTGTAAFKPLRGHSNTVTCITVSPDGQYVVSGSQDNTVRVWNLHTGAPAFSPLQGHSGSVTCIAISPDGQRIISGSADGTVRVWGFRSDAPILNPLVPSSSPNDQHLISGLGLRDSTIQVRTSSSRKISSRNVPPDSPRRPSNKTLYVMAHELARSLTHDGWVLGEDKKPLFWLPKVYQRSKVNHSQLCFSTNLLEHPVSIDLSKFKSGTDWTLVRDSTT